MNDLSQPPSTFRGGNYAVAEDEAITKAYILVSNDPITGSDQKGGTYYDRIYAAYKAKKPVGAPLRKQSSVETRCRTIQKECTRFSAMFSSVKQMKRSGVNETDEVRLATALFNKREVEHPNEDVGPKFRFLSCWELLRHFPKFAVADRAEARSSQQDEVTAAESEERSGSVGETKEKTEGKEDSKAGVKRRMDDRPPGRQYAKQQRALEEHRTKKLRMAKEAIDLQKRHVEALERHNDIQLFTQGPGGAQSSMAKQYFAMQQKKRLQSMQATMDKDSENDGLDVLATEVVDDE